MIPTFALVGRPNVGKSTLFNRLTRSRDALVADQPGLTRDRHYGRASMHGRNFLVVDTAGFDPSARDGIVQEMARQAEQAIAEADMLLFLVDARQGLTPHDEEIAVYLRRSHKKVQVVVNKAEGQHGSFATAEFHRLGLGEPVAISASHGEGVVALMSALLPEQPDQESIEEPQGEGVIPRIAVAGRPNVGKSTLINALLGEERVIAFDAPGTTRDAISILFEYARKPYTLVDTAGLRRKGKVFETAEKFSVIKTLQAIENANVVVLVLDASQDIADQDAHIAGFILETGRSLVLVVNKWDAVDNYRRDQIKQDIGRKLGFLSFASTHTISALHGRGLNTVMKAVDQAYAAAMKKFSTPKLTRVLQEAVAKQAPPRDGAFRPKLRYAHQGGMNPPVVVIHGTSLEKIPASYVRFLEHTFTDAFRLRGTPLRIRFKNSHNPYETRE